MHRYLVLSAVGHDKPGIVETVSKFILQFGCNIEDSRMAVLGGEFALIVLVSGAPEKIAALQDAEAGFGEHTKLTIVTKTTSSPADRAAKGYRRYSVHAVGLDHEGIVHQITRTLASLGVNIEALESTAASAPITGAPQFILDLKIEAPPSLDEKQLREKLNAACEAVNVDAEIKPA
ncbi:MAG: glycine cleavage system protein R [Verrucomicrobia bacterium]|nr:glycine cleavage system protein R [Verrucomicrobiota bacterium]